ncbi:MAG: hypothetical protein ACEQSA_00150 [Weeksellaceae bacterium]
MRLYVLLLISIFILVLPTQAQEPTSRYTLELEPFQASPSATLSNLSSEDATLFRNQGYIAQYSGEDYIQLTLEPGIVTLSELNAAGRDQQDTKIEIISTRGYQLSMKQLTPLQTIYGDEISITSCDSRTRCTINQANIWESTTSGLGYHLTGQNISHDWRKENSFRPFPTESNITVVKRMIAPTEPDNIFMSIKAIKPSDAAEGNYQSTIEVIAISDL